MLLLSFSLWPNFCGHLRIEAKNFIPALEWLAGDLILVSSKPRPLFLNHQSFSLIHDKQLQMAVPSVYSPKTSVISHIKLPLTNWREGFRNKFRAPQILWQRQILQLQREDLEQARDLRLPSSVSSELDKISEEQRKKEWQLSREILADSQGILKPQCFRLPVQSLELSPYGRPRRLSNGKSYYHTGLDLRAWEGTPIRSMGNGRIAYQGFMSSPGNNVILDHGGGLFSRYMHFSSFGEQQENQTVARGEVIGFSGSTGRSQAAHLHFEIIWKGNHASPRHFLRRWEPICDPG